MSETIEERYERLRAKLQKVWEDDAVDLLDDLMAEREKKVNLDEIFPKEVMDAEDTIYEIPHPADASRKNIRYRSSVLQNVVYDFQSRWRDKFTETDIVAVRISNGAPDVELARVRVRLGLTVQIVEKED